MSENLTNQNNKRIAKNTMFLYVRMGLSMLVGLYTSRIVLNALGVENYGIYNVVGSFIVAFTFISGPLGTATQRFLNFELGKGDGGKLNQVFNLSFYTYVALSLLLLAVVEIAGIWFLNNKMQMPMERRPAAMFAFHMSAFTLLFGLLKTPFESLIIAYERMSFYAYVSIAEVLLKLLNAILLLYVSYDKLKIFATNILVISVIVLFFTAIYCRRNFKVVAIQSPGRNWNWPLFKELMSFSGWSLFGSVASMSANQGLNLLLNLFFGVVVNAAMGVASQVNHAVVSFVSSFQMAFRPQLIKYYAQGDMKELRKLIINTSKYSYLLLFFVVCPVSFNMEFLLKIWLKNPPGYATEFCIMMLLYALLESVSAPMWMTIQATGKIKRYQLVISSVMFCNVILSYVFLKMGYAPVTVLVVKCCLDVVYLIVRLLFVKYKIDFSIWVFVKKVVCPIMMVTVLSVLLMLFFSVYIQEGWTKLLCTTISFVFLYAFMIFWGVLGKKEREKFKEKFFKRDLL